MIRTAARPFARTAAGTVPGETEQGGLNPNIRLTTTGAVRITTAGDNRKTT